MKAKLVTFFFVLTITSSHRCFSQNSIIDERDFQEYKYVKIENTYWFTQNLNYKTSDSECYDNLEANCSKYGMLYSFEESNNVCPNNWNIPTKKDIISLKKIIGSKKISKLVNPEDWSTEDVSSSTNELGLSIKPGGRKYDKDYIPKFNNGNPFYGLGISASFWLSDNNENNPFHWHINHFGGKGKMEIHKHGTPPPGAKLSIICIKKDD